MKALYLDYAAATPLSDVALQAMQPFFSEQFYNPSATYQAARTVRTALSDARKNVAAVLGCRDNELIFTAGGTEANNIAVHGVMSQYPKAKVVISGIEHDSVRLPAAEYSVTELPTLPSGHIDIEALKTSIDDNTVLVSVMYVNNEIGTVQPIRKVAQLVKSIRTSRAERGVSLPLLLHTDACQAGNYLPLMTNSLGIDLMTINGGKIYGPKQSAVLYVKSGVELKPIIQGGGQERKLRSGTENVAACVGLSAALVQAQNNREAENERLTSVRKQFCEKLVETIPGAILVGRGNLAPHIVSFCIPEISNERLIFQLDQQGIMVAAGSACSASSEETSHVLAAVGLSEKEARSTLRVSFGKNTNAADLQKFVDVLKSLVS